MTEGATEALIRRGLKTAAAALGRSFECASPDFWPASGNNDIAERHITHHLASAFSANGYQPYFEAARRGKRVDLLLVKWHGNRPVHAIAVEAKLLYSTDAHASALARDVEKLAKWKPNDNFGCVVPTHRVVVASMWCIGRRKNSDLPKQRRLLRDSWTSARTLAQSFQSAGWQRLARAARDRKVRFLRARGAKYPSEQQHLLALLWTDEG